MVWTYGRAVERKAGLKAIIASGFAETDRVKALQRLELEAFIKEPYAIETLGMAIKLEFNR